ncbi:response regulator [Desulfovulcanus sp.]
MAKEIFLIESNNLFLQKLIFRLKEKRFDTFHAQNFENILEEIRQTKAKVVILDLQGLQNKGLEIIKKIKKKFPHVPIIIINDTEHIHLSIKAMQMGVFDDLYTPFDLNKLISMINEALLKVKA